MLFWGICTEHISLEPPKMTNGILDEALAILSHTDYAVLLVAQLALTDSVDVSLRLHFLPLKVHSPL